MQIWGSLGFYSCLPAEQAVCHIYRHCFEDQRCQPRSCFSALACAVCLQDKLEAELDAAGLLVTSERPVPRALEHADLSKLTFLCACLKEAMRLHPTIPMVSRWDKTQYHKVHSLHRVSMHSKFTCIRGILMHPNTIALLVRSMCILPDVCRPD